MLTNDTCTTTFIRGLPGSGKTTYARKAFPDSLLIECDQMAAHPDGSYRFGTSKCSSEKYIKTMLKTAYKLGLHHVVVTCAHPGLPLKKIIEFAKKYSKVRVAWLDYNNGDTSKNDHKVPEEVLEAMKNDWYLINGETFIRRLDDDWRPYVMVECAPQWFIDVVNRKLAKDK